MDVPVIQDALKKFSGIQRRLEFKGETDGVKVFDDYGHHPSEIRATLSAVREGLQISGQQRKADRSLPTPQIHEDKRPDRCFFGIFQ
jgi:UDP-N-acetylmuramate-alanine ligase